MEAHTCARIESVAYVKQFVSPLIQEMDGYMGRLFLACYSHSLLLIFYQQMDQFPQPQTHL